MQETAKKSQPQSTKKAKGKAKQSQKQKGNKLAEQATSSSVGSPSPIVFGWPALMLFPGGSVHHEANCFDSKQALGERSTEPLCKL